MRVPLMNSCLYSDLGRGARYFQVRGGVVLMPSVYPGRRCVTIPRPLSLRHCQITMRHAAAGNPRSRFGLVLDEPSPPVCLPGFRHHRLFRRIGAARHAARPADPQDRRRLAALPRPARRQHLAREGHPHRWPKAASPSSGKPRLGVGYAGRRRQPRPAVPLRPPRRQRAADLPEAPRPASPCGRSSTPPTTATCSATTAARAAAPSSTATASTSTAPRGCCTASAPPTASCSGRSTPQAEFGVVQNFFGVGSTPVSRATC